MSKFWAEDITALVQPDKLTEFVIHDGQTREEMLNSITRFGIYASLLLAMYHKNTGYLYLLLLPLIITYVLYDNLENFEVSPADKKLHLSIYNDPYIAPKGSEKRLQPSIKPTLNNPFGNRSVVDYGSEHKIGAMHDWTSNDKEAKELRKDVESKFNYNLFKDLGDLYGKENSQRQFYTVPDRGSIPNDYFGDFRKWIYGGNNRSCKEDPYECSKNIYNDPRLSRRGDTEDNAA